MSGTPGAALRRDLARILGAEHVIAPVPADSPYNFDATGPWRGLTGRADAVVTPGSAEQVAAVMELCLRLGVPLTPRGGGSGVSGGACPVSGGVVCALGRINDVIELAPELWRMHVGAGLTTAHVHRLARESGLLFPPDPGAAEQSQIGGNVATNAGGPHAFKYGSTGAWVTGLTAILPPGEIVTFGGASRKDVAGYDLMRLLVGSEGTLGVIASVCLKLIPAPKRRAGLVAFAESRKQGCEAILAAFGSGTLPAALDFLEGAALAEIEGSYPGAVPQGARFALIAELDGGEDEVEEGVQELRAALQPCAIVLHAHGDPRPMWRWREGASGAVAAMRGGKVSEDVVVPVERLEQLLDGLEEIAASEGLASCAWGHGGDGNAHATVLVDPRCEADMEAAERVTQSLFPLVAKLGGSVSGEHGIGWVKRDALALQWGQEALALHRRVKASFDPKGLLNPGKKGT